MKKVVFTFGRMNPPTVGHQKLVQKVQAVSKQQSADARVYLSHTQNKKKDPLDYNSKVKYATKAFGSIVTKTNAKTIIQVLKELQDAGYTDVTLIVGSDRIPEFKKLLTKYNGKDYSFNSINFTSAGQRDPDAEGVEGMSASKMRALAVEGDFASFKSGLPKGLQSMAKEIYNKLRNIMEEDDKQLDEAALTLQQRQKRSRLMKRLAKKMQRKKQIAARRMADSKKIQKRALKKARQIVRKKVAGERGEKYATLAAAQKISIDKLVDKKQPLIAKIAKKLLPKVRKAEMERLKKARSSKNEERETLTLNNELNERIDPRREPNLFRALTAIEREKQRDLQKFDRMRDTARVRDTIYRNRKEEVAQDSDIKDREGTQPAKYHSGLKKSTKATRDAQFKKGAEMDHKDPAAYPDKHAGDDTAKTRTSKHTKKYHDMFGEARKCTKEGGEGIDFGDPHSIEQEKDTALPPPPTPPNVKAKKWKDMPKGPVRQGPDTKSTQSGLRVAHYEVDGEYELSEDSKGALQKKADKSGIPYSILKKVYDRGMAAWRTGHRPGAGQEQWAYARVNSFITKGKGTWGGADKDLAAKVKKESVGDNVQPAVKKTAYAKHPRTGNTFNPFSPNDAGKTTDKVVAPNQSPRGGRALTMGEDCWDGYKQVGMKKKGDKMVPDCVPEAKKEAVATPMSTGRAAGDKKKYDSVIAEGPLVMTRNQAVQVLSQVANEKANKMSDVQLKSFAQMLGKSFNKKGSKYVVEEDQLDEAIIATHYHAGAEKTEKGYRPHVTHKEKGHTMYSGGATYKSKEHAVGHAKAYVDAYAKGGDRHADRVVHNYKTQNQKHMVEDVEYIDEAKSPINITRKDLDKINSSSLEQAKNIMHKLIQNAADKKTQKRPLRADKANVLKRSVDEKRSKDALLKMAWNMFMAGDDVGKKQGAGKVLFPSPPGQNYRKMFGEEVKELGPEGTAKEKSEKNHKKKMLKDILPKSGAGQEGTDELVKTYKDATPGQGGDLTESVTGIGTLMTAADLGIEMQGAFAYHPSVEEFVEEYEDWGEIDEAAEYQGKKVKLNNPFRLPSGSKKKFGVYVKNDKGNVVKVTFGDPNMEIKRDDPKRRAAFRSRHSCDDDRGPKWKARYWSCYQWRAGKKVDN